MGEILSSTTSGMNSQSDFSQARQYVTAIFISEILVVLSLLVLSSTQSHPEEPRREPTSSAPSHPKVGLSLSGLSDRRMTAGGSSDPRRRN